MAKRGVRRSSQRAKEVHGNAISVIRIQSNGEQQQQQQQSAPRFDLPVTAASLHQLEQNQSGQVTENEEQY